MPFDWLYAQTDWFQATLKQIQDYWTILAALLGATFFLYKLREEEVLKTRLGFVRDCYVKFAELVDVVDTWAHPVIRTSTADKDREFAESLNKVMPEVQKAFHGASVLLRPETVRELNRMFIQLGLIRAEYSNWKMYLNANQGTGAFSNELVNAFENARNHLPRDMHTALSNLLVDSQSELHGTLRLLTVHGSIAQMGFRWATRQVVRRRS